MEKKQYFSVEDFMEDKSFRNAVFRQDYHATGFWKNWLDENPLGRENAEEAKRMLLSIKGEIPSLTKGEIDSSVEKIMSQLESGKANKNRSVKIFLRVAASVILLAMCGMGIWNVFHQAESVELVVSENKPPSSSDWIYSTNTEDKQRLVLFPDGSSALLKKNSTVRYPRIFNADKREIYLNGEAFFEISKNAQWPFVIQSGELITKVLGTSFTIRAYPVEKKVTVIVKTGKVQLYKRNDSINFKNNKPEIILTNEQQASLADNEIKIVEEKITAQEVIATPALVETFQFNRTPLDSVFSTLESVYGVKIIFDDKMATACTLTAALSDEPFTEKLAMIAASLEAEYGIEGRIVTIQLKKKCN